MWLDDILRDDPDEPRFDPVHLGTVLIVTMVAVGVLYWLLWTLLVFEGGIFQKVSAVLQLLFTPKTLKDLGYEASPYAMGVFEGWFGNVCALVLSALLTAALYRTYHDAKKRKSKA